MRVTFWGTRGSIPTSGASFVEFGGDTPCLEVRLRSTPHLLILEAGSGIRALGLSLLADSSSPRTLHLALTHAHWDHIQGFPFFMPAYDDRFTIHVYCTKDPREFLAGQMRPPYFPVGIESMRANLTFHHLEPLQEIHIGGAVVRHIPLPHPQGSTGFRVDEGEASFVLATDTEHDPERLNADLVELAAGAGALIYDAQYTPDEYDASRRGWGHSTFQEGVKVARAAAARRLVLFSHDPTHHDAALRSIEAAAREQFAETISARQGTTLEL